MKSTLKKGSRGVAVLRLQQSLGEQGFGVGPQDARFGAMTLAAVHQFQQTHIGPDRQPLKVDGVVGADTTWALRHASGAQQEQPAVSDELTDVAGRRRRILEIARNELGVCEDPDGSNGGPRVDVYTGRWRVPWCALFVSWVLAQLPNGSPFGKQPFAAVARIRDWAQERGRYHADEPAPADVFIMLKNGGDGVDSGHGHTGFVVAAEDEGIRTIEGNCGNAVRMRLRPYRSIAGYVRVV